MWRNGYKKYLFLLLLFGASAIINRIIGLLYAFIEMRDRLDE